MKKIIFVISLFFMFCDTTFALSDKYVDRVSDIVGSNVLEDKVNIYLFYSSTCPHCHKELKYFDILENSKYKDNINIYTYEVTGNDVNNDYMISAKKLFDLSGPSVPFTIIGDKYLLGYGEGTDKKIEDILDFYINDIDNNDNYKLPLLGNVNGKKVSIIFVAIVLGLIDGFNPCAMWILLLLINMCLSVNNRKKMIYIGSTFILTSGLVYFLSMLGIGFILDLTTISIIRGLIGIVALVLGVLNIRTYIKTRNETGCHVASKSKRKSIIDRINKILESKSFILGLLGCIILAVSVNLVELACSLGFPTIFLEILSINNILGFKKIIYIFVYIFFYLIDDFVIFLIAVFTLKSKGISTKYNKIVNLVGGFLMIIMGILLLFKPEWIMFNF
ncbi:MAG: hypothetical protein ACI4U4_00870 [Bacilli bacterium]